MPQVGKKNFAYTPGGIAKARREERITGNKMVQNNTSQNQNYKGGVNPGINSPQRPQNPNTDAVNNFMNRSTMEDRATPMASPQETATLQAGLNKLNARNPNYQPLKVDGQFGPKTKEVADNYLGRPNRRRV